MVTFNFNPYLFNSLIIFCLYFYFLIYKVDNKGLWLSLD